MIGLHNSLERSMLIDTWSQASYIQSQTFYALKLPQYPCSISILGNGGEITGKVKTMTK